MKKYSLAISLVGLAIQAFAAGFMLYGVNNNERFYNIGLLIFFIATGIIAVGLIILGINKNK